MSKLPPFARTVSLYVQPKVANITPRWLQGPKPIFGIAKKRPQPLPSDQIEAQLEAHYKLPNSHYALSGSLAIICGWQIGNRAVHEWPVQFGFYDIYFPSHH